MAGSTDSDDFPIVFPIQPEFQGGGDGFVTKIAADGSSLLYSTYLGGSGGDLVDSIATDNNGNVFLTGVTSSPDFPQYIPLPGSEYQGGSEAFVT
ncbi:MAG: cell surface protein, partial [candidate division Zixibacteria bacterium]|nr:cell surface protein [candidate division Zixibacteria bacterium]NIV07426.1 cell surface protein [candidate division Zixibacteria bacterium]